MLFRSGYGSFGAGSVSHIFMELLKQRTGADVVHVPYKGAAPALQDLVAGQVAMMIVDYGASRGFITSEKIRPIITTTREAHARLPTLPTAEAAGVRDYNVYGWVGLLAPAGTPMPVVNRLREEVVKAVPELTKQYADLGIAFETRTPEQFSELIRQDLDRWGPVMKSMNLQLD